MPQMVTQPAVVSQSAVLTMRLPHEHRLGKKKFRRTAPCFAQRLSQRPAPVVVDVDAASSSAPLTHLLSEDDLFPTDNEAALK